jgi:hypothetical protein
LCFYNFYREEIIMRRKAGWCGPTFMVLVSLLLVACLAGPAGAQGVFNIIVDEHGNGFSDGTPLQWYIGPDPGPGGLPNALIYILPIQVLAGDVLIYEPATIPDPQELSDVIRFINGNLLIFYSDNSEPPPDALADIGFPILFQPNIVPLTEVGNEGNNGVVYTPVDLQPGQYSPAPITYQFVSDGVVPLPPSAWMLGSGLLGLLGFGWRSRQG